MRRTMTVAAAGLASLLAACNNKPSEEIAGDYTVNVFETRDTCDGQLNSFGARLSLERDGGNVTVRLGDFGALEGQFDDQGVIQAQGPVQAGPDGSIAATMQVQIFAKSGSIRDANGRLTFDGTFPGESGTCVQEFTFSGSRDDLSPIVG